MKLSDRTFGEDELENGEWTCFNIYCRSEEENVLIVGSSENEE